MYENLNFANGNDSGCKSSLVSKNITVFNRRTSIRLEPEMWSSLKDIARREKCTMHNICALVDIRKKPETTLTAAIRVFIMLYYRSAATDEGHRRAGHGDFAFMKARAGLVDNGTLFARKSPPAPAVLQQEAV